MKPPERNRRTAQKGWAFFSSRIPECLASRRANQLREREQVNQTEKDDPTDDGSQQFKLLPMLRLQDLIGDPCRAREVYVRLDHKQMSSPGQFQASGDHPGAGC